MQSTLEVYRKYLSLIIVGAVFLLGQAMSELMLPTYMSDIINNGIVAGDKSYIYRAGVFMIGLAFLAVSCAVIASMIASRVAACAARDIRGALFRRVMSYSQAEFDQFSTASLITRSTNDVQNIQQTTVMMLRMAIFAPIMGAGALINAVRLSPGLTWTIALGICVILSIMVILFFAVMPKFTILQERLDHLNLIINERLSGLLVVRAFNSEEREESRFDDTNNELTQINIFINRAMAFMFPSVTLIMNCMCVLIIWAGAKIINTSDLMVGEVMAFMQYSIHVVMSFLFITMIFIMIPRAAVSARRIGAVLDMAPGIVDAQTTTLPHGSGILRFSDVDFAYPGSADVSLSSITFTAHPGQTTAIIGGTGSGKSSLVSLIPRFYDITSGSITIDDVDIRDMPLHDLRAMIGFVPQKNTLFNGTIRENIKFGNDDATEDDIRRAAMIAQADEFIDDLPAGYDTLVAQGGTTVSGGQKQRLAIARALIKRASINIFDDSFSALDFSTDAALRAALKKNTADATTIIVAQRINTIAHADQIIVLNEGKMVGIGTHNELLSSCDIYREIAASQLSEAELEREFQTASVDHATEDFK